MVFGELDHLFSKNGNNNNLLDKTFIYQQIGRHHVFHKRSQIQHYNAQFVKH